jgi:hypothetical protein
MECFWLKKSESRRLYKTAINTYVRLISRLPPSTIIFEPYKLINVVFFLTRIQSASGFELYFLLREQRLDTSNQLKMNQNLALTKCFFQPLWDTDLAGKTYCAYVKNLAKDGSSIRMKSTTYLKGIVEGLHKELLNVEKSSGLEVRFWK